MRDISAEMWRSQRELIKEDSRTYESNLVSYDVCEEIFECDKCDDVFVDKTDLRTHMDLYHEVLE